MREQVRLSALFVWVFVAAIGAPRQLPAGVCALPGGGAISGRVTAAATSAAIADAELVAERIVDGFLTTVATTTSGPTGHYQFAALVPGDYFVRTQATALLVDEVCACHTQRCAMDAKGKAEKIQLAYGKQVKGAEIPQAVLDNYLEMETCYREVNEGKR